ncbi:UNVERIFIED_CONTAM: protein DETOXIFICATION 55 [Sesamum radiatum]|uniref:Protein DETOXIFICATION 55 n=1 Tax=Sesamum radiatum TaxID=300843 RepID=A0AAW2SAT0_SESRA
MAAGSTKKNLTIVEVMEELKNIVDIGFPILIMGIFSYLKNMISVACIGRLGSLELAGGALAIGFTNITGYINYAHDEKTSLSKSLVPSSNKLGSTTTLWEEWGMLLRLAIPSCLGVCLEWWWYELMTLLAGYLYKPHVALATSAIVIQTTSLMYTLPSALSASISTRVGNELGASRPQKARLATAVVIALAFSTSIFGFLLTTLGRGAWGRVFTNDNEVLELTMAVLPIIGLCELANCPQTTCCGVLRGSARPSTGAGINFCSFYLMGTPVAVALAFYWELGFVGLCYGLLAAQIY